MLNFAFWPALWLGLALLPIIFFYFLRMRFRRQPLGATYLWRRLVRQESGGHALHWKSILLLILQILALLCLVFAAAGPSLVTVVQERPGVVFLLDDSASMASTEGRDRQSRFVRAAARLGQELAALPGDTAVTVFLCSGGARALENRDRQARIWKAAEASTILGALARLIPGSDGFREDAVVRDLQVWQAGHAIGWQAILIGDGGCDLSGNRLRALFGDQLRFYPIGETVADLGLLSVSLDAADSTILRLGLNNSLGTARPAHLRLSRDGRELGRFRLTTPSGQSQQELKLDNALAPGGYQLDLVSGAAGNEAWQDDFQPNDHLALAINQAPPIRILHLGEDNPFLGAAFAGPGYRFITLGNVPTALSPGDWDLVINELDSLPAGFNANLLSFGTLPPDAPVGYGLPLSGRLTAVSAGHPLDRFVDWQDSTVTEGQALVAGPGAQVLATVGEAPLLVAWERAGYRQVAFGCQLYASDLVLSGGFPVFLRNLVQWSVPQFDNPLADNLRVGESSLRSAAPDWNIDGTGINLARLPGELVRLGAEQPGLHAWAQADSDGWLAVRIPESESSLSPRVLPGTGSQVGTGSLDASIARRTELSLVWLALLGAIALLALEWLLWQGVKVRRR